MLSFLALIKTFSACWSTLIVMIYEIFASQTEHIFAIYARTEEHFMGLLRAFWKSITAKYEQKKSGLIAQYALDIYMVTSKCIKKLHEKYTGLSCSTVRKRFSEKIIENTCLTPFLNRCVKCYR